MARSAMAVRRTVWRRAYHQVFIELLGSVPNERTLQFVLVLFLSSDPVLTACLAQSRASSRGAWLAEQGVAPGFLYLREQSPGRLGPPPVPIAGWGLPSMAGRGRTEGRRKCRLDRGEVRLVCPAPGRAVPRGETPQVERREVRVPVTRRAAPQGADEERSAFRRSAPSRR